MKLFTVKLTDDERLTLEAYRARVGLRSAADAVRHLIAESTTGKEHYASRDQMLDEAHADLMKLFTPPEPGAITPYDPETGLAIGPKRAAPGSRLKKP